MNSYTVTIESNNGYGDPEVRMLKGQKARTAHECHKNILWANDPTDEIISIFDEDTNKLVYQKNRGFIS
jgi:hypothetical protein